MAFASEFLLRANKLRQDKHRIGKYYLTDIDLHDTPDWQSIEAPRFERTLLMSHGGDLTANPNLLDELQTLLNRLGAVKVLLSLYLVEFGGLPQRLAHPLLQEAAGSCAMLRLPCQGQHLVIYLGPEPSLETGGFVGRLRRGLVALTAPAMTASSPDGAPARAPEYPWAEVRDLQRCNHDIAAPAFLLQDLSSAAPRVLGIIDW